MEMIRNNPAKKFMLVKLPSVDCRFNFEKGIRENGGEERYIGLLIFCIHIKGLNF